MACQICGNKSGYYPLCTKHNSMRDAGKVKKCDSCGKWIDSGHPLCKNCYAEEQKLAKKESSGKTVTEAVVNDKKVVTSAPLKLDVEVEVIGNQDLVDKIYMVVRSAEKHVKILSPYIESVNRFFDILEDLIKKNCTVDLVIKSIQMDSKYQKKAIQGILGLGVNIRTNDNLHSKLILVDDKIAIISSFNLTRNAFLSNDELGVLTTKKEHLDYSIDYFNKVHSKGDAVKK